MNGLIEWIIFSALSVVVLVCAAGMIITMSMYRAGLALMASFVALAGLFILLDADLLAAIQIMMNVGGMLVMVLFMVMMMMDPGGEMMWGMKRDMHMPGPGAFSMHMPHGKPPEDEPEQDTLTHSTQSTDWTCPMHPEVRQNQPGNCPKCGMQLIPVNDTAQPQATDGHPSMEMDSQHADAMAMPHNMHMDGQDTTMADGEQGMSMSHEGHTPVQTMNGMNEMHEMDMSGESMNMSSMTPQQNYQMMVDMAMSTSQLPWAIVLGIASALLLCVLVIKTPWPLSNTGPTQDATTAVGELLLSRYMIAFEGAAFLILAGIAGAVIFARREQTPGEHKVSQSEQAQQGETPEIAREGMGNQTYTCPMHPEIHQSQPGNCPKCGMQLIPVAEGVASGKQHDQKSHSGQSQQGGHI